MLTDPVAPTVRETMMVPTLPLSKSRLVRLLTRASRLPAIVIVLRALPALFPVAIRFTLTMSPMSPIDALPVVFTVPNDFA